MKNQHTPGSWRYHVGRGTNPRLHVQTESGYQIASTPELSRHRPEAAEQEANARLIAAAPDMLASLRVALTWMETYHRQHALSEDGPLWADIQQAREVIAKAEGKA